MLIKAAIIFICFLNLTFSKRTNDKPDWAKKDIRDFNDVDIERLYDQWEEDDEPLEEDELPEHLRKRPTIDMSKLDPQNPETLLRSSKKHVTLMSFVKVKEGISKQRTEEITKLWQSSLMNNHINADRYPIDDNRVIFMFKDGSQAWEAKDFLVEQQELEEMTIENKSYFGKYSSQAKKEATKKEATKKEATKKKVTKKKKPNEEL